ncbi:MAG: hypothetical protein DME08_24915 [Candidatus Rokuibacteriota bacterium]|nr:MAG: hypothetical protein DME08_24915 [Candidatus Rokubacteria bacterium]
MAVPLVTNGDGNHAAGLAVLVSALHDLGVVHVLAPETRRRRSTARRRIASTSACSACCPDRHVESPRSWRASSTRIPPATSPADRSITSSTGGAVTERAKNRTVTGVPCMRDFPTGLAGFPLIDGWASGA